MTTNHLGLTTASGERRALHGVLFDLDGTLYRQGPLRRTMLLELLWLPMAMRSLRRARDTLAQIKAYRAALETLREQPPTGPGDAGDLASRQCALAARRVGCEPEQVRQTADEWLHRRPLRHLRRFRRRGVDRLLATLREHGVRCGVFSDYPVDDKLHALDLTDRFDIRLSASDPAIQALKPDPTGLLYGCERLGSAPEHTLYVGDRIDVDGAAAKRAGMPCAIVGGQARRACAPILATPEYADLSARLIESPEP